MPVHGNHSRERDAINVLFAVSQDNPVTLSELEVAIKSVLLHAPMDNPLTIHIMADSPAYLSLNELWVSSQIASWRTRNPITIHVHHIDPPTVEKWKYRIRKFFQGAGYQKSQMHLVLEHTIGAYFRLYANQVLPTTVETVLYMDTDVVLLVNLQILMPFFAPVHEDENRPLFYWTANMCSGFMVIDIAKLPYVWNLTASIDLKRTSKEKFRNHPPNDQLILRALNLTYPDQVGLLSSETWDGHSGDSLWRFPYKVSEHRPRLGMLHFNGGGSDMGAYFEHHQFLTQNNRDTQRTFGLAKEQVYLPWSWAQFRMEALICPGENGFLVQLHYPKIVADEGKATKNESSEYKQG